MTEELNYFDLYCSNKDFKEYVDGFAKQDKASVEEILKLAIVKSCGDYYYALSKNPVFNEIVSQGCLQEIEPEDCSC